MTQHATHTRAANVVRAARLVSAISSGCFLWWAFGLSLGQTLAVIWAILGTTASWKHIDRIERNVLAGCGADRDATPAYREASPGAPHTKAPGRYV